MKQLFFAADYHVAESTIQPLRLIQSQGYTHYNYNVHRVDEDRDGERVTMYRYNVVRFKQKPTVAEIEKMLTLDSLDSKDSVTVDAKIVAPVCTETPAPVWSDPVMPKEAEIEVALDKAGRR